MPPKDVVRRKYVRRKVSKNEENEVGLNIKSIDVLPKISLLKIPALPHLTWYDVLRKNNIDLVGEFPGVIFVVVSHKASCYGSDSVETISSKYQIKSNLRVKIERASPLNIKKITKINNLEFENIESIDYPETTIKLIENYRDIWEMASIPRPRETLVCYSMLKHWDFNL